MAISSGKLPSSKAMHIEHLKNQIEHLRVLKSFHLFQMGVTTHPQLFESYRDIADGISEVISQYEKLLVKLQSE